MRIKPAPAIVFLIAVFLSACSRHSVSLESTNANGEVPRLGNLVFRFSQSLFPDSLLNNWDSTEYISFEPRIPGRFRWNGPDELVFSPAQPLLPATSYEAKIRGEVLRYSKFNDVAEDDKIRFYTPALRLEDARAIWVPSDRASAPALSEVHLHFNYPVAVDAVKEKLKLTVDDRETAYTMKSSGTTSEVSVQLTGLKVEDRNYDVQVKLDKGLRPEKGSNSTESVLETQLSIPSPYVLDITDVESEHDGSQGIVHIRTSQQLSGEEVSRYVRFDPAVAYTVDFEEDGITLRSDRFNAETSYNLSIQPGLRGRIGGVLREAYSGPVAFGQLEPDISFSNSKAIYLSRKGSGQIEVRITNTPKVRVVISKIYESNLLMAQRYGYYPRDEREEGEEEEEGEYSNRYSDALAGDVIYSKEIDTRSLPRSGGGRLLNIAQFEDRLPEVKGIYHVMVRSTTDYWIRDSRFLSFSDIGLIARQGQDRLYVFANSIRSAEPVEGVTVNVYGSNNQLLGTAATNGDGAAEVPIPVKQYAGFRPAMVVAKTANDFTYLPFSNTRVNTSRFDVGGKRNHPTGLDAFVYAERDIYRPGERLNFSVLLRDRAWKSPGALPVKLKFLMPNGKELKSFRRSLNEQGAADGSIDLAASAITGTYTLEVYTSSDVLLATKNFMIEEFVPDRIRVATKMEKTALRPGESSTLQINAVNFFGPPAANRKYETEIQVQQKAFRAKKFDGYDFSFANQTSFSDKDVREGKTDASGNAAERYEVPSFYANKGLLQASFYTTVFDETGRPVSRHLSADIFTQDVFHGVREDGYNYYALNQPVNFTLVSVNTEGSAITASARVQVIKHDYHTILARSDNYFRYESQQTDKVMADQEIQVGATTVFRFVPRTPGDYELRVYRPGANVYVKKNFYSYGSWGPGSSSFDVNTEGHIDIETDRASYGSGNTARLLFKTPFNGRMLVTVETDHVLSYQYLTVLGREARMELKLNGAHVPNAYVTATLIKAHGISDIPLTVAHGFQNIQVEEKDRRMPVTITAKSSTRSKTRQTVRVTALPGSYVTLAAVDNGVLQVSDFKTPDPYGYFYQKKALQVSSYDLYPLLFPELRTRQSSTGGDGDLDLEKRVNPMPAKRFRIVSYWSGMRKANSSGVAEFTYDIPQFSGQVRLMAVAFRDEKFGSAESTTTVADPLVLSSSLPRFMSPGDTVQVPVTISNTTARGASGQATLTVGGPVKLLGPSSQTVSIAANSEARVNFSVVADPTVGVGRVNVEVNALGEKFREETEISVRPPSTLQKLSGSGSIAGGTVQKILLPAQGFLPGSFRYDVVVSRSAIAEIAGQLRDLVQYPYGCTEQTVSAAFPQLYFGDFANLVAMKAETRQNANSNVLEAIRRIKMRQLYNGAVTLWDGEGEAHWWTTVYAAHFLLEAKKAGFDVDNSLLETMLSYLAGRLKTRETISYYYNRNQNRKIAPKEVAYSLYVLALAGRSQVPVMNYYKANTGLLALDSRYLLSAAYAVGGDRRSFAALLPSSFSGEESVQQSGGSFYSVLRDEAISLNMLVEVDPGNAQIPLMRQHVVQRLKNDPYPNTQENAFAFLALGKLARNEAGSGVTAEVRVGGKKAAAIDGDWKGSSEELKSNELELVTKGKGRLYYSWVAEGISSTGAYREEDNFVRVRRRFYDRFGKPLATTTFHQNDLVIVELTLDKAFNGTIENIVLTDLLPAGFEIENPRTKELPGMDWIKDDSEPLALDVRDDRIHFFVDAHAARQRYYYAVRAVSTGLFHQGPVSADALYQGEIHSYHGAQTIRVLE